MTASESAEKVELKRQLGLFHGVGVICALILGGGIFITPKGVILATGSVGFALILWSVCGVFALFGALCFAEIGTTYPSSGGEYAYLHIMYGPVPAFLYLWSYIHILRPSGNAIKCLVFASYVLQGFTSDRTECSPYVVSLLALNLAGIVSFMNIVHVKLAASGQALFVGVTVCVLLLISIFGIVHVIIGGHEFIAPDVLFEGATVEVGNLAQGFYSGIFTFSGWNAVNVIIEEVKSPFRNVPRAILISMAVMTTVYLGVNFAYFAVLGPEGVKQSHAVGADFAAMTMGSAMFLIPLGVATSTATSLSSGIIIGSRMTFVGSRSGHFPQLLGLINIKFYSPITAILYQLLLTWIFVLIGDVKELLTIFIFLVTLFHIFIVGGMVYNRYAKPQLARPLKVPVVIPLLFLLASLFLLVIPIINGVTKVFQGFLVLLCTAVPYYILLQLWNNGYRHHSWKKSNEWLLLSTQKALYCCVQDLQ